MEERNWILVEVLNQRGNFRDFWSFEKLNLIILLFGGPVLVYLKLCCHGKLGDASNNKNSRRGPLEPGYSSHNCLYPNCFVSLVLASLFSDPVTRENAQAERASLFTHSA